MDNDEAFQATDAEDEVKAPSLIPLSPEQARVLGCLIEKEVTTPETYPLTLNSLMTACNQTTNREPVVRYDESTVVEALDGLKRRGYVLQLTLSGARVQKYKHTIGTKFGFLDKPCTALLAVLMLRGIQTSGELRQRTERYYDFADIPSVEHSLQKLIDYPGSPLVVRLPSGGGRKTVTYAHLLSGMVDASTGGAAPAVFAVVASSASAQPDWCLRIEQELADLRAEVARLRAIIAPLTGEDGGAGADELPDTGSRYVP